MPEVIEKLKDKTRIKKIDDGRLAVEADDNDWTSFKDVWTVLIKVANHPEDMAFKLTEAIHNNGKAIVFHGTEKECILVQKAMKSIIVATRLLEWKW